MLGGTGTSPFGACTPEQKTAFHEPCWMTRCEQRCHDIHGRGSVPW